MRIEFSKNVIITSSKGCFVLEYHNQEYVYKSFDLLLISLLNKDLADSEADGVEELVNQIKEFKDFVYGIFAVSEYGEYIKSANKEYTGVDYGK